jgi:lipocalin-like protein
MKTITLLIALAMSTSASAETLQGRWKLVDAVDLRPDGTVARYPWGRHPIGSIVVQGGSCMLQIMATEVPDFTATDTTVTEQMKASLLSSYIAYTGPCTFDDAKGVTTMKVEGAWRPDYVGTQQTRYYRFEGSRMIYGPAPSTPRVGGEPLQRRLTLERP